ncbi:uncharacterized protein LOC113859360 [Abrus precatorius]|uniref:Uncharacterized protein LOC113859360 n=1 Tax=Abrus precatorius TaxID=3816 RepID=A0A8B8L004_ABRPR|nr:uncharacterized protein LOC113859360 [Abrus precatorius]
MEFSSFHLQHQLQEESAQCIASATPPSLYKPSTTTSQSWIPSTIYNGSTSGFITGSFNNSRELGHKHTMIDSLRISTGQAYGFHNGKSFTQRPASDDLFPAKIKGEMNRSSSKSMNESCSLISTHEPQHSPSFLSNISVTGEEFFPEEEEHHVHKPIDGIDGGMALTKRYNFGDVSSNLPTLDMSSSIVSCSLGLNHQALGLHTSYNNGSYGLQPCYDTFGLNEAISLSHRNMHGLESSPTNSSQKISSFTSEVAMKKRSSCCSLPKEYEGKAKKSRSSCPSLKVRKERLGDRIQTLQRLVAPFGKTSTASVLSEAIGYILFLRQQIQRLGLAEGLETIENGKTQERINELRLYIFLRYLYALCSLQTLSIPYMKSAQNKPSRMVQLESNEDESREFKPDLRSRGLCLVPLSYASFINRCS